MYQMPLDFGLNIRKKNKSSSMCYGRNRSEHLVVHSGIATSGCWSGFGAVGSHGIVTTLSAGEIVGHFRIELFDCLLLLTLTAATAATTSTGSFAASLSSSRRSLVRGRRLGLVLLRLSIIVSTYAIERNRTALT